LRQDLPFYGLSLVFIFLWSFCLIGFLFRLSDSFFCLAVPYSSHTSHGLWFDRHLGMKDFLTSGRVFFKITRINAARLTILLLFLYRIATRSFSPTPHPDISSSAVS
jgi:hypothetical protein